MTLFRVLPPAPPDDGQVQHAATFGDQQGQQPVGEVVEVSGSRERGFHGSSAHHDQAVNVAGAVGVLPAAVGQTPHRDVAPGFVHQRFVAVGHHRLRAGIQRIGQLREGAGLIEIVGIDEGHQRQSTLRVASGAGFTDAPGYARHDMQLDRRTIETGDAGLAPFGRLVQGQQMNIDAGVGWRFHQIPPQYWPQRRP